MAASVTTSAVQNIAAAKSLKVAVIGAGAAGLVAARELVRAGHKPIVHEQSQQLGGVWVYSEQTEADKLGGIADPRERVHSSLYATLRTNLPREVMGYLDLPFLPSCMGGLSEDARRFPSHQEVLRYLQAYAQQYDLQQYIRYNSTIVHVSIDTDDEHKPLPAMPRWTVKTQQGSASAALMVTEQYDCVVVGNGHYTVPMVPNIPGQEQYSGMLIHSHTYRHPDPFIGLNVLVLGAANSGTDIAFELSAVACKVHWCARRWKDGEVVDGSRPWRGNIQRHPMLAQLGPGRKACLADGTVLEDIDAVVYCTGYMHHLPFLHAKGIVETDGERVYPLYQHVIPPKAPSLAFIGLPYEVAPFPLMQLQSAWIASIWAGYIPSPSIDEMQSAYNAAEAARQREGIATRYTHRLGDAQWAYLDWLLRQLGWSALPAWRKELYLACRDAKMSDKEGYRDGIIAQVPFEGTCALEVAAGGRPRTHMLCDAQHSLAGNVAAA